MGTLKTNSKIIPIYIKENLRHKAIAKAFVFGSVAQHKISPSDCDLFIVTNLTPLDETWILFIEWLEAIQVNFNSIFGIKLNATINIEKEFLEISDFKNRILAKNIIPIIN